MSSLEPDNWHHSIWRQPKIRANKNQSQQADSLSDTNSCIQVIPQVDFAFFVIKNASVKKCVLIHLYCSILLLAEKFLVKGPSTSCFLNCVVTSTVFFVASISMRQSFNRRLGVTPQRQPPVSAEILPSRFGVKFKLRQSLDFEFSVHVWQFSYTFAYLWDTFGNFRDTFDNAPA